MRLKYYMRLFGQMNVKRSFVLLVVVISLLILAIAYILKSISPVIKVVCESSAKTIALKVTEETVNELITNVEYDSLMNVKYNEQGKIIAINANVINMNKLSSEISYKIQEKLSNLDKQTAEIPLGKIWGLDVFSGYGPTVKIKIIPVGNTETEYKTEFISEGINQTKHTIYLDIKSTVNIIAPFMTDSVTATSRVTVAETVVIGDIPEIYYNITGSEDGSKNLTLNGVNDK